MPNYNLKCSTPKIQELGGLDFGDYLYIPPENREIYLLVDNPTTYDENQTSCVKMSTSEVLNFYNDTMVVEVAIAHGEVDFEVVEYE
ncbi:hypothetical protein [Vibrio phage RYC]|nr:hypothetical protein [Vibrio phage RYC]